MTRLSALLGAGLLLLSPGLGWGPSWGQSAASDASPTAVAEFERAWNLAGESELQGALEAINAALRTPDELGPRLAAALEVRADLRRRSGDLAGALGDVRTARELHPRFAEGLDQLYPGLAGFLASELLTLEAEIALECGLPDLARPALDEAWSQFEVQGAASDPQAFANWVRSSLNLALAVDDVQGALDCFEQALAHPSSAAVSAESRGTWAVRVGVALCMARALGMQAVCSPDRFLATLLDQGRLPEEEGLPWVQHGPRVQDLVLSAEERASASLWLVTALLDAGRATEARTALEDFEGDRDSPSFLARRARAARELGADAQERAALAGELRGAIDALATAGSQVPLHSSGHGWLLFGERRELLSEWIALRAPDLDPQGASEILDLLLSLHSLGTVSRQRELPPADGALLRELLGPRTLGLSFIAGRSTSWILACDRASITLHELPADPLLQSARVELLSALQERLTSSPATRAAAEARLEFAIENASLAFLPGELQERIAGSSRLVITAGQELGSLPWGLLRGAAGRWLGATHAIEHWPSVPLAAQLVQQAGGAAEGLLAAGFLDPGPSAIGSGAIDPRAARVFLDAERLRALLGLSDAPSLELLAGSNATLPRLTAALAQQPALACLTFHGRVDATGRGTELLCAPGGPGDGLGANEAAALDGLPRVVALLACGALRAPLRRGDDGGLSLPNAFLAGGSACVLAAPTPLGAEATFAFWRELAVELAAATEGGAAEALRRVRARAVERGDAWEALAAPFAFRAVGWGRTELPTGLPVDADALSSRPWRRTWPWVVLAALVIGFARRRAGRDSTSG